MDLSHSSHSQNLSETGNKFIDTEDNQFDSGQKRIHDIVNKYAPEPFESNRASSNVSHQQGSRKTENYKQSPAYSENIIEERSQQQPPRGLQMKQISHNIESNRNYNQKTAQLDPKTASFPYYPHSDRSSEKKFSFGPLGSDPNSLMKSGGDTQGVYDDLSDGDNYQTNKKPSSANNLGQGPTNSRTVNQHAPRREKFTADFGRRHEESKSRANLINDEKQIIEDFDFYSVSEIPKTNRDEYFLTPERSADHHEHSKSSEFLEIAFETPVDKDWNRYKSPGTNPGTQYSGSNKSLQRGFSPEDAKFRDSQLSKQQQGGVLIQDQWFSPNYKRVEQVKSGKIMVFSITQIIIHLLKQTQMSQEPT